MWPLCNANNSLWLLLPLLLGLLTGWWAWSRSRSDANLGYVAPEPAPVARVPDPTPVAPAAKLVDTPAAPAPKAAPVAAAPIAAAAAAFTAIGIPAAIGDPDDLLQIKGVGPKLNSLLNGLGITRFDQISKWGAGEISKVDSHLGNFQGRIARDNWVEQAGLLARGAIAEFESKFGKLDSENQ